MAEYDLTDAQWCFLDLLMRARQTGIAKVNRMEVLNSRTLPQGVAIKLIWAALTIPGELISVTGAHDFSITEAGASLYNLRFGKGGQPAAPTQLADAVICLPGPGAYN